MILGLPLNDPKKNKPFLKLEDIFGYCGKFISCSYVPDSQLQRWKKFYNHYS